MPFPLLAAIPAFNSARGALSRITPAKIAGGVGILIVIALSFSLWRATSSLASAKDIIQQVGALISTSEGASSIKVKDIVPSAVRILATKKAAERSRDALVATLNRQTSMVIGLADNTKRMRLKSSKQVALIQSVTLQRNEWIRRAEQASSAKVRETCEVELAKVERVLDALYENGF